MSANKIELLSAVLLSVFVLNHCLEASDQKASLKTLRDADEDFPSVDILESSETNDNRKIVKRVVDWSSWRREGEQADSRRTLQNQHRQPGANPSGSVQPNWNRENVHFDNPSQLNADWTPVNDPNQFSAHSHAFHQQNTPTSTGNAKWSLPNPDNEFSGQSSYGRDDDGDDDEWYEGVPSESKKSRKEKMMITSAVDSRENVAKFEPSTGVQCPTPDATGLYVYPPDCKFYVTCWNGRAFLEPCAPGTLFSPQTLECDFPNKVKCYGSETTGFANPDTRVDGIRNEKPIENQPDPTCSVYKSGITAHPSDCTKYLQCVNGNTFIMECGPGTVFNPLMNLCDYPHNVKGCEGAIRNENTDNNDEDGFPDSEKPQTRHDEFESTYSREPIEAIQQNSQKIQCPPDFSGLLAHPDTCEKFLQCVNGITYVMECGTGTVFNPITFVCDWPYYVPGCTKKKSPSRQPPTNFPIYEQSSFTTRSNTHQKDSTLDPNSNTRQYQKHDHRNHFDATVNHHEGSTMNKQNYDYRGNFDPTINQWQVEGLDNNHETSSKTQNSQNPGENSGNRRNNHSNIHHHIQHKYEHHSEKGSSNSKNEFPQYDDNAHHHPHRHHHNHEIFNNQGFHSRQPQQSGYDFNGHGYPYNSQAHGQNQPNPESLDPVNEEENSAADDQSEEHSLFESESRNDHRATSAKPLHKSWTRSPNDRSIYGRTNSKKLSIDDEKWSAPETPESDNFQPSTWRGMGRGFEQRLNYPARGSSEDEGSNYKYKTPINANVYNSDIGQRTSNVNLFSPANDSIPGPKPFNNYIEHERPVKVLLNVNGTGGHYITKTILIDQGHSRTRKQNAESKNETHVMSIPTLQVQKPTWKPKVNVSKQLNNTKNNATKGKDSKPDTLKNSEDKNKEFVYVHAPNDSDIPTVSIELEEENWNSSVPIFSETPNPSQETREKKVRDDFDSDEYTAVEDFDVETETLDGSKPWKPQIVFENKKQNNSKDDKSVVMKINHNTPSHLLDIEVSPFLDEEPPFPKHYTVTGKASSLVVDSFKPDHSTPLSGQIIRLRGGENLSEGYVEVQGKHPGWGVICDSRNGWNLKEAHVVCKQLGYGRGAETVWQGRPKTSYVPKWIAASSVTCYGNETRFQLCKFAHESECQVDRDAVGVRCLPNRVAHCRQDEVAHNGQCYYVAEPNQARSHDEAHDYCHQRGSRLLDIIDQPENDFISELLVQSQPQIDSVMTAGMGFKTLNVTLWMWEDSSISRFKFNKWWPGWTGNSKSSPAMTSHPLCILMKRKYPCYNKPEKKCKTDYFFWDVEDCASKNNGHSFICKRPYDNIGCIYGNGNQYFGNASIAVTGRKCLSWSDPEVARALMSKVPNRPARDELRDHNFCRNPNAIRESKPWCFTGPRGEYEYCDIPHCGKISSKKSHLTGKCKPKHFECLPGECIPSPWVCDGEKDCTNGADEQKCSSYMNFYKKILKHKLDGYEVEKWLNTPAKTCALRCKEAEFTCRSFTHLKDGNVCYLSDSNIGMTGALVPSDEHDYYEMRDRSLDCEDMFVCGNQKCINRTKVCDGKNDCLDRSDEKICSVENLGYAIRLSGANATHEGRVEIKILDKWGQVCDDSFDMIDATVICRELGFSLGALEVRPGGFYGNLDPPEAFMVDQLQCKGNETTIRECDFEGWGKHNCEPEEAVGVVCKTELDLCQKDLWKCDNAQMCIPTPFICDEVVDCPDGSDESPQHCTVPFELRLANGSSPMEGRVEIRHHGIWGTVCDDDFSNITAKVICNTLGYGGPAMVKKNGFFGPGTGPIWLDEVFCTGNETQLYHCEHDQWGRHNCNHDEDAGVICTAGAVPSQHESIKETTPITLPELNVNELLPTECGKRPEDFNEDDELIFERVVRSSIAPPGSYPWQASIRVRGHSKSSHWCGAVILSPLHVLTAAHCLQGYNKGTYFVRAGDYNTEVDEGTEAEANIEDYYVHEEFRKGHRLNNDIAVVLLKGRGIPLGRHIMPICLPHENIEYASGLNCTISGFGNIEAGSSAHSRQLRFGWVPLLNESICKADYVYGQASITDGMICAGHLNGGPDTCDGDSGGPLACPHNGAFTLYGLTSWGQHCGRANRPGVYVRIAHYRKWIDQKIKESLVGI